MSTRHTSTHLMKMTKHGIPFLKDTLDLFASFILSLNLATHNQFFRFLPNSFTTDDAVQNLSSVEVLHFSHHPNPKDPSKTQTTTTTTTFSMSREMAMTMGQHFMDARLIENALDSNINLFKKQNVYHLSPKGLHVLDCFISDNVINTDQLESSFQAQLTCTKLLHLERRSDDDEIIFSQGVIILLFRRFAGRLPNYTNPDSTNNVFTKYSERSRGIQLHDYIEKSRPHLVQSRQTYKYCFGAVDALDWLCDFTSTVGRAETAAIAARFVGFGLISLVYDKRKKNESGIVFTVNLPQGEFRCTNKAAYRITEEGSRVAQWDEASYTSGGAVNKNQKAHYYVSLADRFNLKGYCQAKPREESNAERLRTILDDINTRHLFREFLRTYFCEEDLSFWLDVDDFKRKFSTTVSAVGGRAKSSRGRTTTESHHASLVNTAFSIYNRYLAPSSQCKLNIDHELRAELDGFLEGVKWQTVTGRIESEQVDAVTASQLQTLIKLYECIQSHVFELMATDPIPKFVKTAKYLAMRKRAQIISFEESVAFEEADGAFMTVSRRASELEYRQTQGRSSINL